MEEMFLSADTFNQTLCWDLTSLESPSDASDIAAGSAGEVFDRSCADCPCAAATASTSSPTSVPSLLPTLTATTPPTLSPTLGPSLSPTPSPSSAPSPGSPISTFFTTEGNSEILACSDALQAAFAKSAEVAICDAAGLLDESGTCRSPATTTVVVGNDGVDCDQPKTSPSRRLRPVARRRRLEVVAEYTSTLLVLEDDALEAGMDTSQDFASTIRENIEAALREAEDLGPASSFLQRFESALVEEVRVAGGQVDGFSLANATTISETVSLTAFGVGGDDADQESEDDAGDDLSGGEVAGIVIGAVAAVALAVGAVLAGVNLGKKRRDGASGDETR